MYNGTKMFKDIIPDYEHFAKWYKSTPLSSNEEDCPSEKTFTLIEYEYACCHVAFTADSFLRHFAIDLYTFYREFEGTTKKIDELMALDDNQVANAGQEITNVANVPEVANSTDAESIDFVSTQQKMISKKGDMQVKREQLSNQRNYTVRTFLNRFKHLFIKICSDSYTPVFSEYGYEEDK